MRTLPDVEYEMQRLVAEAQKQDIFLRLIGGLAVKVHCPHANHRALERERPDIDFVAGKADSRRLRDFLPAMGYAPNKTFNTLNGDRRQLYYDEARGRQIDVFIGDFEMCHKLPMADRLAVEPLTVPLAELFLSKAQIVELNHKDVLDLLALLLDHQIGNGDQETINVQIIADLCAKDWGLHTTVSMAFEKLQKIMTDGNVELDQAQTLVAGRRLATIRQAMEAAPKTLAWKMRAKVGTRVRWYEEVEEVQR
jgi:hypothetical protein